MVAPGVWEQDGTFSLEPLTGMCKPFLSGRLRVGVHWALCRQLARGDLRRAFCAEQQMKLHVWSPFLTHRLCVRCQGIHNSVVIFL